MISVVIPNLNSPVIGQVLAAVQTQADTWPEPLEVRVVGQDVHGQVHSGEQVHLFETPHPVPPSQARNIGAALAQGEILIFLDADCVPQPGWLAALLEAQVRWPEAGAISGAMLPEGDTFAAHCRQIASFHEHLNVNPPGSRRTLASFSLLVPRSAWQAMGGFDERFKFAAAEDLDFSIRLSLQGRLLYFEPRAAVRHRPQRSSWQSLWRHSFRSGSQSAIVRSKYADYYRMRGWMLSPWTWVLLSPAIAFARALQIYIDAPCLRRYWRCAPWVVLSKLAWCWGAATGLRELSSMPISPSARV